MFNNYPKNHFSTYKPTTTQTPVILIATCCSKKNKAAETVKATLSKLKNALIISLIMFLRAEGIISF